MNKEKAIKYLQELYPNGGHCWLDEQRIEAISMAIKALQEEPVREDLEKAYEKYTDERLKIIRPDIYDSSYSRSTKMTFDLFEGYELETAFEEGANWQKEQMMKEAVCATIESDLDSHGADYGNQKIVCKWGELEAKKFKVGTKVKLIIIKEG